MQRSFTLKRQNPTTTTLETLATNTIDKTTIQRLQTSIKYTS